MREERVVLVDPSDKPIGEALKSLVHRTGELHRAVSVFLFNKAGDILLQRRAANKYHSAGLWSNTCCGHPRPGESTLEAAQRRLLEEMGIKSFLTRAFQFTYRAQLTYELVEHEVDHVFAGEFEGEPEPDKSEVSEWRWMNVQQLRRDLLDRPHLYTKWLGLALEKFA
jgi:isopentenyl-diphosphate delta-isomerase